MANPRGPTSRAVLDIAWDSPVYQPTVTEAADGRSRSVQAKNALATPEAFAFIAKEDPRPLLVLRECLTCTGTDDALLTKQADNEKTMLMSRWFHCVKVSPAVLEENDWLANLFPGDDPSHLFVARPDGSGRIDLAGDQSRTELWDSMEALLSSEYKDEPKGSLKGLLRLLDEFDEVDLEIAQLEQKLDDVIEKDGPESKKVKKIKRELTDLFAEKNDLRAKAVKVSELELKPREKQAQAAASPKQSS